MWEVYAYQNTASLFGIFNATAAIHSSGDYLGAIAVVVFCGFLAALVAYAFAPEKLQGWRWLASVVLVYSVLILPRATVGIVDKVGASPVQVVDNVPLGIAALGSLTSTIGHTLTGLFETAFQSIPGPGALPSELGYQRNGLMFGSRLIRETSNLVIMDPMVRTDVVNYLSNCTLYDIIDGTLDAAMFSASKDIWSLIPLSNPARFTPVSNGWMTNIRTCPEAHREITPRLLGHFEALERRLAVSLHPTLPSAVAGSVIAGQIQQAYLKTGIADAAATSASIIRQNAIIHAVADAARLAGQRTNDPAATVLAIGRAQATAQQNAAWLNYGKVAEQALPVFRNVIEAITYAMFPLVVLLLLLNTGQETLLTLKGYASILIWIQLWPPLFAVLNYMASIYAAHDLAAAATLAGGDRGLTLQTSSTIYARAISGEAMVGYLAITIPMLAWGILKRMESFGTSLTGGLTSLQGSLSTATSAAAAGNVNLGNVSMDQMHLAPNRTSPFMSSWQNDLSGNTFTSNTLTGRTAANLLRNQGFASRVVSTRVSQQDVQEASRQVDAARSESVAASTERSAALSEVFTKGVGKMRSIRSSTGSTTSSFEQMGETLNRLDQITQSVADTMGLSQSQVANIAFGAAGHLGFNTPIGGGGANAVVNRNYLTGLSALEQKVLGSMSSEQLADFKQFGDRVSRDTSFASLVASDAREAREMSSRLSSTATRSERADASLSERMAMADRISTAFERGESISIDMAQDPYNLQMFMRYAEQYGGTSASAQALMASELARQSLRPSAIQPDGSPLPTSFDQVREQFRHDRAAKPPASEVDERRAANDKKVSRFHDRPPSGPGRSPSPETARAEVEAQGAKIRAQAGARRGAFDARAEITRDGDGTLGSTRSLLKSTAKQVTKDADSTLDNVQDAARDMLRKR
jgi:conjugal transfer mating pair stabilization protein TraG